jgi:hypothetical protein
MPRNGSGQYVPPSSSFNPAVPETTIVSEDWNDLLTDMADALTDSLSSDGQTPATERIPFAFGLSTDAGSVSAPAIIPTGDADTGFYFPAANQVGIAVGGASVALFTATGSTVSFGDGTVSAPSIAFASDPNSGFYHIGADNIGLALNGAKVLDFATTGLGITGALTVSGATTLNGNVTLGDAAGDVITVTGTSTFAQAITATGGLNGAVNGAVGGVTPAAGAFTTLTASGAVTLNGAVTLGDAAGDVITSTGVFGIANGGTIVQASTPATNAIGYLGTPQNAQAGTYGIVMTDIGKDLYFTATATVTIPANASVLVPIGSIIELSVDASHTLTISITSDTLRWVPSNGTGTRTLTGPAQCVIQKKTATEWWVSGLGLS